jgi:hypothetical protein
MVCIKVLEHLTLPNFATIAFAKRHNFSKCCFYCRYESSQQTAAFKGGSSFLMRAWISSAGNADTVRTSASESSEAGDPHDCA